MATNIAYLTMPSASLGFEEVQRVSVIGRGWTGQEWSTFFSRRQYRDNVNISETAERLLSHPEYDGQHRLLGGEKLTIAIMTVKSSDAKSITDIIKEMSQLDRCGRPLKAEASFLLSEKLNKTTLKKLGIFSVTMAHQPIDCDGLPSVLSFDNFGVGRDGTKEERWLASISANLPLNQRRAFAILVDTKD